MAADPIALKRETQTTSDKLQALRGELRRLEKMSKRMVEYRARKKAKIEDVVEQFPGLKEQLAIRQTTGRPRLEEEQPELLRVIAEIAIQGSGAHERAHEPERLHTEC